MNAALDFAWLLEEIERYLDAVSAGIGGYGTTRVGVADAALAYASATGKLSEARCLVRGLGREAERDLHDVSERVVRLGPVLHSFIRRTA
jgi:hypothetical protein